MSVAGPEKAIFLDRDGVINVDSGYPFRKTDAVLMPGVPEGLKELRGLGYQLIVITNQSGVARGIFTLEDVHSFHAELQRQLQGHGVQVDDFLICPHHPDGNVAPYAVACTCRKPGTKLIDEAVKKNLIDRSRSFLIGDRPSDMSCAFKAGLYPIQIVQGQYEEFAGDVVKVKTFLEAVAAVKAKASSLSPSP